jgi:hypothetical protein
MLALAPVAGMTDALKGVDLLPQVLSWTAVALLLFVSVGVIYLSAVEWRDSRRRKAAEPRRRP